MLTNLKINKNTIFVFFITLFLFSIIFISNTYAWKCPVSGMSEATCKQMYPVENSYVDKNESFSEYVSSLGKSDDTDYKMKLTLSYLNTQIDWIVRIVLAFCTITSLIILIINILRAAASQDMPMFRHMAFHSLFKSFILTLLLSGAQFFYYLVLYFMGK